MQASGGPSGWTIVAAMGVAALLVHWVSADDSPARVEPSFHTDSGYVDTSILYPQLLIAEGIPNSESVMVKYMGKVPLDSFECHTMKSGFIGRVCYDESNEFMVIKLNETYYPYCEVDVETMTQLLAAESKGRFYQERIRGDGNDGPFDCRTHDAPDY